MFVLAFIPLSFILRKTKAGYEFSKSKGKIINLLFMDNLKVYSRRKKGLDSSVQTIRVFSEDIGMEFGIKKYYVSNGERKDCEVSWYRVPRW